MTRRRKSSCVAPWDNKPWLWYAPTLLAPREQDWESPGARHAWIFDRLLAAGIHVAGVDVGESWGSPQGRVGYDEFYDFMTHQLGFSRKPGMLAVSRGGLMAYNWAAEHPACVACVGGVYPVCNLREYHAIDRVLKPYAMSREQLFAELDRHNPVDRLRPLAEARVPILHLHGDQDRTVPLETHSAELMRRYKALGGGGELFVVPGKGHEICPELWEDPRLTDFFIAHLRKQ